MLMCIGKKGDLVVALFASILKMRAYAKAQRTQGDHEQLISWRAMRIGVRFSFWCRKVGSRKGAKSAKELQATGFLAAFDSCGGVLRLIADR